MTAYSHEPISVANLTTYIQKLLEGDRFLKQIWVTGEISSINDHAKGLFFTLRDTDGEAVINCVVWSFQQAKLLEKPQLGDQVQVLGSIRLFSKRGEYQFTAVQILPVGEGLLALRHQQMRARLEAEGLFDSQRKRPLPAFPRTVAVVTSPLAAAWGDIQRTLEQRYPSLHVVLSPATVQGQDAPDSIVKAIKRVNLDARADVMILARGGGAVEDLSCFNDEKVVRAIALSAIPVITGIGHQRDESFADLVADFSAHTPTAAAEKATPNYTQLVSDHQQRLNHLIEALLRRVNRESEKLVNLRDRILALPETSRSLLQATAKCEILKQKLVALDPQAVLERGYAVVRLNDQTIVNSTANLDLEQELIIQLGQGLIKVKVSEIFS